MRSSKCFGQWKVSNGASRSSNLFIRSQFQSNLILIKIMTLSFLLIAACVKDSSLIFLLPIFLLASQTCTHLELYPCLLSTCQALNSSYHTDSAVAMRAHYKYLAVLQGFKYFTTVISYLHKLVVDCKCQAERADI